MTILQEFGSWWFHNVFLPYSKFVYVENLGWAMVVVAVVTTILLGLFYKPNKYSTPKERALQLIPIPVSFVLIGLTLTQEAL